MQVRGVHGAVHGACFEQTRGRTPRVYGECCQKTAKPDAKRSAVRQPTQASEVRPGISQGAFRVALRVALRVTRADAHLLEVAGPDYQR